MVERKRLSPESTDAAPKRKGGKRVSPKLSSALHRAANAMAPLPRKGPLGSGRPVGARGKDVRVLSELIKAAAELNGSDGKGKDGLEGWLREMCKRYPKQFLSLMGKLLPLEVRVQAQPPPVKVFQFTDEMLTRFTPEQREQLERLLGGVSGNAPPSPMTYNADPSEFERIIGVTPPTMNGNGVSH